jgi:purine-binding chemotaxis protein CheW
VNNPSGPSQVLLARLASRFCAFPLPSVVECMRPLPTETIPAAPRFLRGVAVIRGAPTPVVDLAVVVGAPGDTPPGRYVLLRVGDRRVAVAVDRVLGVFRADGAILGDLPPLLQDAEAASVAAIGMRDEQLVLVLNPTKIIPEDVWRALESSGGRT